MAAPPPAFNPDTRPLPDGCITRYDENYRAWYYVDTRTRPPRSSWEHPLGPPPSTPSFAPPSNPPSNRANYGNAGAPPFSPQPAQQAQQFPGSTYSQPPSFGGGFNSNTQDQSRNFQQQPYQQPAYGGPPGNYANPGNPGWPQQGWQQQPSTIGYQSQPTSQAIQQPPRGRTHGGGMGLGGAAALGVGGLVGGALLANAFEDHEDRVREDGYEQGFDDGQSNNFGGDGGGFDGGDW